MDYRYIFLERFVDDIKVWSEQVIEEVKVFNTFNVHTDKEKPVDIFMRDIDQWIKNIQNEIFRNVPNIDVYRFIDFVMKEHVLKDLNEGGFKLRSKFTIRGDRLFDGYAKWMVDYTSERILRIFKAAGYDYVITKISAMCGKNDPIMKKILDVNNIDVNGIRLCPIEHGLFLIRSCSGY